jgi:hypothetical protein
MTQSGSLKAIVATITVAIMPKGGLRQGGARAWLGKRLAR